MALRTACRPLPRHLVGGGYSWCPVGAVPALLGRGRGGYDGMPPITGCTCLGVVRASSKAHGGAPSSKNRAHRPGGDGESSPGGGRSILQGPWRGQHLPRTGHTGLGGTGGVQPTGWSEYPSGPSGRHYLPRTGHTGLGGTGSLEGVVGVSFTAYGEASSSKNRAHRPGGDRSPAQGVVGESFRAHGEASSSKNRAHRPGGDGESSPRGGRSILQGPWGGIIFQEPGTPAWGERGVQPRGWPEYTSGPMGRHHLPRTGHTSLG